MTSRRAQLADAGDGTGRPYDVEVLSPGLLAAALVVGLLALVPARRLFGRGFDGTLVAVYFVVVWLVGVLVLIGATRSRLFVPILLILYVLPFVTARSGLVRLLDGARQRGRSQPRNVTPVAEREKPSVGS